MWNKRCFPDWKQKRPQWWSSDGNANGLSNYGSNKDFRDKLDNDEVTAMIRVRKQLVGFQKQL